MKKNILIGVGIFVGGLITGAVSMLVYKNIKFGKQSKLHEENYNNLNDLFMPHSTDGGIEDVFEDLGMDPDDFEDSEYEDWPDEVDTVDEDFGDFYTDEEA